MRRRNQKIGIVSYSSRKEEETLINKKRSSSNHKWEGRASAKKGARRSFILPPQPASRLEKRDDNVKQSQRALNPQDLTGGGLSTRWGRGSLSQKIAPPFSCIVTTYKNRKKKAGVSSSQPPEISLFPAVLLSNFSFKYFEAQFGSQLIEVPFFGRYPTGS